MTVEGAPLTAHRLSWLVHRGFIPAGAHVLHRCDNRACCNPGHLFLGDDSANVADKMAKGRYKHGRKYHGEQHHATTLTLPQVEQIRASKESAYKIAPKMGVCVSTIYNIRKGVTWAKDQTIKRALNGQP